MVSEALILLLEGFPIACLLRLPPLGLFVAEDLLPNPVPPFGFRPLSPKGLPQDSDTECPLGLDISGCTGRVRSLSGEGNLTSCVLRAGLCARVSFADETSRFTLASTFARTVQHVHVRVQTCFLYFA